MITTIVIVVVVLLLLAAFRLWLTANRLDRLHVRTEAAWAVLEGALARRIVAARALALVGQLPAEVAADIRQRADTSDAASRSERELAEQALAQALETIDPQQQGELADELADTAERVSLAGRFYNDAVRDTRALRASWFTQLFRLAGHALLPEYFDQQRDADGTQVAVS